MGVILEFVKETLSSEEKSLADSLRFDRSIINRIKPWAEKDFTPYFSSAPHSLMSCQGRGTFGITGQRGISFQVLSSQKDEVLSKFKTLFSKEGYEIFLSDLSKRGNSVIVTIIKTDNPLEIIRLQKCQGENQNITNRDIISQLTEWDNRMGIEIMGAGYEWVQILFKSLPDNIETFMNELKSFCPGLFAMGMPGEADARKHLNDPRGLFFWWD